MTSTLVAAPVLVPLATALALLLSARRPRAQRAVGVVGSAILLACAVALVREVLRHERVHAAFGGWALPFAIEFSADRLNMAFVFLTAVMGLAVMLFDQGSGGDEPTAPARPALVHGFIAGACGAFLTADLFNLYVWFEVTLIASLGLLTLGARARGLDATFKFFILNIAGTLFLLAGVAYVYAATGHLNYTALRDAVRVLDPVRLTPLVTVLLAAFLIKAAAFPVFAWLPASYHTLPAPLAALFAAVGTKLGVYALLRLRADVFAGLPPGLDEALGWIAAATMITGVLGAAYHWDVRRILAFHSISQVGYMLLGVALHTQAGAQGTVVFAVHHGLVKANLFLLAALIRGVTGSYDLRQMGGVFAARPWLGALFLTQALALVGMPPLSGFWAKLLVVRETLLLGHVTWAVTALAVGALTLYSMAKIWIEAFWKPHPRPDWRPDPGARQPWAVAVAVGLACLTLVFGIWPEPALQFAWLAAGGALGSGTP